MKEFVGVDGCRGGWVAVALSGRVLRAIVSPDWTALMTEARRAAVITVDMPIGLPTRGARSCDREARRWLGRPRGASVFPPPVRGCQHEASYPELCARQRATDGRGLTKQAFNILPKIRQLDRWLAERFRDRVRIFEVHPEVSFACWNRGRAMRHHKSTYEGRLERERLIDELWPGARERLWRDIRGGPCERDDLNDALAALWSARRIADGTAVRMPRAVERDETGLLMQILA